MSTGTLTCASEVRVLVTGSREWSDEGAVWEALYLVLEQSRRFGTRMRLFHGHCPRGADRAADKWGTGWGVDVSRFPAHWDLYGRRAGRIRNTCMVEATRPHLGLAFHVGNSPGTAHCVSEMIARGIPVVRVT